MTEAITPAITPEEYMTVELIKKQLNLDQYTDKQITEIRDSFRKSADRMLAYVKKKETAKHGSGGWTKDRYLKILSDLAVLDKTLQTSLVDKTLDAGKAAFISELKTFEGVLSVKGLSPGFEFIKLHPETLEAYLKQTDIGGAVLKDWTEKAFTREIRDKIRLEIMSDAILGESYQAIESRLKKAYSGIDKTLIESLVRTHIQSVNNTALEAVAEKNKAVIKNVRWLATLDTKCCMICGALDGNIYPIKSHPSVPIHPRCRCVLINIVKSWDELGVDVTEEKVKKKIRPDNFKEGVPAKTDKSFAEKFEEFTEKEKRDFIGTGRYKYLKDGKLEFKDLVNEKTGELYKVADLDKAVAAKLKKEAKQEQSDKITENLINKTRAEQAKKAAQVEKAQTLKVEMAAKKEAAEALAKKQAEELAAETLAKQQAKIALENNEIAVPDINYIEAKTNILQSIKDTVAKHNIDFFDWKDSKYYDAYVDSISKLKGNQTEEDIHELIYEQFNLFVKEKGIKWDYVHPKDIPLANKQVAKALTKQEAEVALQAAEALAKKEIEKELAEEVAEKTAKGKLKVFIKGGDGVEYSVNKIPNQWVTKSLDEFTDVHDILAHDKEQLRQLKEYFFEYKLGDAKIKKIKLKDLKSYQTTIKTADVEKYIDNFSLVEYQKDGLPRVYKLPDGTLLLKDGNHRVNAAMYNGIEELDFEVTDLVSIKAEKEVAKEAANKEAAILAKKAEHEVFKIAQAEKKAAAELAKKEAQELIAKEAAEALAKQQAKEAAEALAKQQAKEAAAKKETAILAKKEENEAFKATQTEKKVSAELAKKEIEKESLNKTTPVSNERITDFEAKAIKEARVNGKAIPADKDQIEDQQILFWEEKDKDGNPITCATFKLTAGDKQIELYKKAQKDWELTQATYVEKNIANGYAKRTGDDIHLIKPQQSPITSYGNKFVDIDDDIGVTLHAGREDRIKGSFDDDTAYAQHGRMDIEVAGEGKLAIEKIFAKLNSLGINTDPPSLLDKEELYLRQIFYHKNTKKYNQFNLTTKGKTQVENVESLKTELTRLSDYDVTESKNYKPDGVYQQFENGYKVQYRPDLIDSPEFNEFEQNYILTHCIDSETISISDSLDNILNGGGIMAPTTDKLRRGFSWGGLSPTGDMDSGGASYFFTRIAPRNTLNIAENSDGLFFKPKAIARLDAISYEDDRFGKVTDGAVELFRMSEVAQFEKCAKKFSMFGGNETFFKKSLSVLNDIEYIKVSTVDERDDIIKVFKKHKLSILPDGRKIEDIVFLKHPTI